MLSLPTLSTLPMTLADWDALPETGHESVRLEVVEGVLVVAASPHGRHQKAVARLDGGLDAALPRRLTSIPDVDVLLEERPLTIREPDLVVVRTEVYEANPPRYPAAEVLLAVEVLSEGTRRVDRILKFAEYADAGIPQYWIVDLEGAPSLTAYVLVDGAYELAGEHTGRARAEVAGVAVELDLDRLSAR